MVTSNSITITVTAAPEVDAGTNMTTCVSNAITFANGATRNLATTPTVLWTTSGGGTFTGTNTLTPTYTPLSGEAGSKDLGRG